MKCLRCDEPILEGDSIMAFSNGDQAMHRNCGLRCVIGSLAHVEHRCSCYVPGSTELDPPGMTLRQAADAAVAAWEKYLPEHCRRTREWKM